MQHPEFEEGSYTTHRPIRAPSYAKLALAVIRVGKRIQRASRFSKQWPRATSPPTGHSLRRFLSSRADKWQNCCPRSLLYIAAAALAARGANVVIEDFSGPVDAFFLDDGTAAGLPSSGNSALEKVDDGLRLNYDVARNGPFGAALMGKIWGGYRDLSNASHIRLTYRVEAASSLPGHAALGVVLLDGRACSLAPHCSAGVGLALTDYLSSGNLILDDDAGGWRTLEIDLCGEANPYAPFFGLDREGRSLDPATVQGWRLGIVVDSLAGFGNAATSGWATTTPTRTTSSTRRRAGPSGRWPRGMMWVSRR